MDVPCGSCNACCRSAQFIRIGPEETATLRRIPAALLVPAPGLPGNVVMGYDKRGHCPMLIDDRCSIYADRPQTCRSYDCRIFAAAGIDAGGVAKAPITERARRWQFSYGGASARAEHQAVRAAAAFLKEHRAAFPNGAPSDPAQIAMVAVKVYEVFVRGDGTGSTVPDRSPREIAQAAMAANEQFEAGRKPAER